MVRKKIILALLASAMMFTALAPHTIAAGNKLCQWLGCPTV